MSARSAKGRGHAYLALAALSLIWSYTWIVVKIATHDASPYAVAAIRCAGGAFVLFAVLAAARRSLRPTPIPATIVYGLLQTTGFTLLQTIAVSLAHAGKVAVLAYTMPFWVALLAWPFLGERVRGVGWIALALAAAGLALVLVPLDARTVVADACAILSGLCWAGSAVWAKRLRVRHEVDLLALTAWQMLWGAIPLVLVALAVPERIEATPSFVAAMAFVCIVAQALAWVLWLFILSRLPAGVAGMASLSVPVLTVALAALQLREIPTATELAGIALIVAALVLNALPQPAVRHRGAAPRINPRASSERESSYR